MAGKGPGIERFWEPHGGDDPCLPRFWVTQVLGFGPVREHSLKTIPLDFHLLIKASQTRPQPVPGDSCGWESGGDRAAQREAWRCGERRQGPRIAFVASQLRVPGLGSAVMAGFKSHICHFLAGDLGQIRFHL